MQDSSENPSVLKLEFSSKWSVVWLLKNTKKESKKWMVPRILVCWDGNRHVYGGCKLGGSLNWSSEMVC